MLYQYDGGSKLSIDVIRSTNALQALVKEYLSSTIDSGILLCLNFVRTKWGYFVTVSTFDDNELYMTKCPYFNGIHIFEVDMKVNSNNSVTMKLQR